MSKRSLSDKKEEVPEPGRSQEIVPDAESNVPPFHPSPVPPPIVPMGLDHILHFVSEQKGGSCFMNAAALLVLRTMARIEGFAMPSWKELLDDMSLHYFHFRQRRSPATWDEAFAFVKEGGSIFEAIVAYKKKYEWLSIFSIQWKDARSFLDKGRPLGLHFRTQRWDLIGGFAAGEKGGHAVLVTAISENSITIQNSWGLKEGDHDTVSLTDLVKNFYHLELFDVGFVEDKLGCLWKPGSSSVSEVLVLKRFLMSIQNGPDHTLSKMFPVLVKAEEYCKRTNFCRILDNININDSSKTREEERLMQRRREMHKQEDRARKRQEISGSHLVLIGGLVAAVVFLGFANKRN